MAVINVDVVVRSDGTLDPDGLNVQVPSTPPTDSNATILMWSISGDGNPSFSTGANPGIELANGLSFPFVGRAGFSKQFVLLDLNNSLASAGHFKYTINYVYRGANLSLDPMIENQPPQ